MGEVNNKSMIEQIEDLTGCKLRRVEAGPDSAKMERADWQVTHPDGSVTYLRDQVIRSSEVPTAEQLIDLMGLARIRSEETESEDPQ